ncbi:hypothetical protein EPA93_24925 [Ktedonosporobacter rubrisoli]|uniref:DNA-binding protein n=1 Tax=Ktedonosporobacter rubrisoli TaxID=2509675 RepID=A0A4P6JUR7_KTERU|nr:hypothetical protein [Ktedonosporobacter rubrisoli]QBD79052.1 hypothetical protein EPA93_24925 [Ktedonosporobacter rubrisoli]
MSEVWVPISDAEKRLKAENIQIGRNKISRLVSRGVIQAKVNPLDARVRLVNIEELRTLFKEYGSHAGEDNP